MLLERPEEVPEFIKRYEATLQKYGVKVSIEAQIKSAFPEIVKRKGAETYFNELLAGFPRIFMAEWLASLNPDLTDLNTIKELFTINQILKDSGQAATRSGTNFIKFVSPQMDAVSRESTLGLSPILFNAILDLPGAEELAPDLLSVVSLLSKDQRTRLQQDLVARNDGSVDKVSRKIRERFDSEIANTLISLILSVEGPQVSPYETNLGGPLSGLYRIVGKEALLHEELKQGIQNLKTDSASSFSIRRKEALESLLTIYRDRHISDLREFSIDLTGSTGILLTALPVGFSFVSTRGTTTPLVAAGARTIARPLVSRMAANVMGPILASAISAGERKLFEGELYQLNQAEIRRECNQILSILAVPNAGLLAERMANRIYTRAIIAKAQGMPVNEAKRLLSRHAKSPAFWDRQSPVQKSLTTGVLGGAAAGVISTAFGAPPEGILLNVIQAGVTSTSATYLGQKVIDIKITLAEAAKQPKPRAQSSRGREPKIPSPTEGHRGNKGHSDGSQGQSANASNGQATGAAPSGDATNIVSGDSSASIAPNGDTPVKRIRKPKETKFVRAVQPPPTIKAEKPKKLERPLGEETASTNKNGGEPKESQVKNDSAVAPNPGAKGEDLTEVPPEISRAFNPRATRLLAPIMFKGMETKGVRSMLRTLGFKEVAEEGSQTVFANRKQQIRVPMKPHMTSDEVGLIATKLGLTFGEFNDATRGQRIKRFNELR